MTDLWVEASIDTDAENLAYRMAHAKVAAASVWPFLASAQSEDEFEHRLALAFDKVAARVEPALLDTLVASMREDYRLLIAELEEPAQGQYRVAAATGQPREGVLVDVPAGQAVSMESNNRPMQFFHAASKRWITVQGADESSMPNSPISRHNPLGNPYYFDGAMEEGPNTGATGMFPVEPTGPEPWNPINGNLPLPPSNVVPPANRFPAEPQPWTVPPNAGWVENPMQFGSHQAASAPQGSGGPLSYTDEGVETGTQQNPFYFSQGTEGVGSQDGGFPPDVALPEPDEKLEMYQNMSPLTAARHFADYHYIHEESPGDWVVTQKGTDKVLSHHDSEEKAKESFRGMMWSKHSSLQFFDPTLRHTADATNTMANSFSQANPYTPTDSGQMQDAPLTPPSSMTIGSPGAEAMPPMTNAAGSNTPASMTRPATPSDPSGSDSAAKTGMRRQADEYRGRPNPSNPTGTGDDYTARTWDNALTQAPRQDVESRGANTPQRPPSPIRQNTSSEMQQGHPEEEDDGDEDDRREAVRRYLHSVALRAASQAVRSFA